MTEVLGEIEALEDIEQEVLDKMEETRNKEDLLCSELQSESSNLPPNPKIMLQEMESDSVISEVEITVLEAEVEKPPSGELETEAACRQEAVPEISNIEEVVEPISQSGNSQDTADTKDTTDTKETADTTDTKDTMDTMETTETTDVKDTTDTTAELTTKEQTDTKPEDSSANDKPEEVSNQEAEEEKRKMEEEEKRKKEEEERRKEEEEERRKEEESKRLEEEQRRLAEEAEKRRREEELERERAKQEEQRRMEEQRKREEELKIRAEEEEKRKAEEASKLEKFDSFDVIGSLVDKENQELARQKQSVTVVKVGGKEKSLLDRELWEACTQGRGREVKLLLSEGADPNSSQRTGLMSTSSPLVTAACRGHTEVLDCLLSHPGTDVNLAVSGGWTALMWASWYGHTEVVTRLLAVGDIKKDKLNNAGKNAVMYAAEAGRVEVCKILLDGVEKYDEEEEDRAVRKNRLDRLLDQALKAGCDVPLAKMVLALRDMKAEFYMTSLHVVG